jgi:hypothetical protein
MATDCFIEGINLRWTEKKKTVTGLEFWRYPQLGPIYKEFSGAYTLWLCLLICGINLITHFNLPYFPTSAKSPRIVTSTDRNDWYLGSLASKTSLSTSIELDSVPFRSCVASDILKQAIEHLIGQLRSVSCNRTTGVTLSTLLWANQVFYVSPERFRFFLKKEKICHIQRRPMKSYNNVLIWLLVGPRGLHNCSRSWSPVT